MSPTLPVGAVADTAKTGTSPEVLQHYLTAGIDCQLIVSQLVGYEAGERSKMVSLNAAFPKARLDFDGARPWINTADMLPVLLPFSALATPLSDGTGKEVVPAVEVAKQILDLTPEHCEEEFLSGLRAEMDWIGDCQVLDGEGASLCWIYGDYLVSAKDAMTPPSIYDYLRSLHFALPVAGRPLVEGVDFVAR